MGLFDRFRSTDNEEDSESSSAQEAFDEAAEGMVDIENRTRIIHEHYDIAEKDARIISELLKESIEEQSIKTYEVIEQIETQVDIDKEQAWEIRDTEHHSISQQHTLKNRRTLGEELVFEWKSGGCSPICDEVESVTAGTPAESVEELKQLLRKKAEKHPEGTPERVDHWVPHHECQSLLVTHITNGK